MFKRLARIALIALGLAAAASGALAQSLSLPGMSPPAEGEEATSATSEDRVRSLIETIEDPERRDQLVQQLETLLATTEQPADEAAASAEDAVGLVLGEISARTDVVREVVTTVVNAFDEVPVLIDWLQRQLLDPATREVWLWVGFRIALVLGLGALALIMMNLALRRVRANLTEPPVGGFKDRLARNFLLLIVELLPVVAFAAAAHGTLAALEMDNLGRIVVLPLIKAVIVVRTWVALFRVAFAPKAPALRLLPMSDSAATYLNTWLRRLVATSVYGTHILGAARRLGLPWTLHGLLLHVLYFVVAMMVIVVIIRSRERVANVIRRLGTESRSRAIRRLPFPTLASLWHILAMLYVMFIYLVWALKIPGGFKTLTEATVGSIVVLITGWVLWRLVDRTFSQRLASQSSEDLPPASPLERRVRRYTPVAAGGARALVLCLVVVGLLEAWDFGTIGWLFSEAGNTLLGNLLTVLVIVAILLGVWELISFLIERSVTETDEEGNLKLSNRTRTLLDITRNLLLVFLSVVALFLILSELGLDVAPLLAGAGVIGLAIGFGSQRLVQDLITGMFMLVGDTMRVGDVVDIGGKSGVVEEVSMRTVQLRDYGGNVHTIPYSSIDVVTNMTKEFSYALFDIGVAYREDVDQVIQVLREVGAAMSRDAYFRRLLLEPLEVAGLDKFGASALVIRARFKTRPLRQWEVSREFNRRLKYRFDELGIEIPFPHQTVYFGQDKHGAAPPVQVRLEGADPPSPDSDAAEPPETQDEPTPLRARSSG